jgi:lysophospholipase L1-like esterase
LSSESVPRKTRRGSGALRAAGNILLIFLSVELSLRVAARVYEWKSFREDRSDAADPAAYRILCVGESTTYGVGAADPERESWPAQLEKIMSRRFPGRKIQVFNRGVGGVTALEHFRHFDRYLDLLKPDLTIFQLGGNTTGATGFYWGNGGWLGEWANRFRTLRVLKMAAVASAAFFVDDGYVQEAFGRFYFSSSNRTGRFTIPREQHATYLKKMIDRAQRAGGSVLVCGYFRSDANRFLPGLASEKGVPYCDLARIYERFADRESEILSSDMAHPNSYGYSLIAQEVARRILDDPALISPLTAARAQPLPPAAQELSAALSASSFPED